MFAEDDLLPISALQHLLFCERQCALIHLERQWVENRLTVEGRHLHRRAHDAEDELRDGRRIVRGLALRSLRYGLSGQADVVEVAPLDDVARQRMGAALSGVARFTAGAWSVTPVEYKRGRPKQDDCDRVQLCAQALCLEEMLGLVIPAGALFYGRRRRRTEVFFDAALRETTLAATRRLHELIASRRTPLARREPKCDSCSLLPICLPSAIGRASSMAAWTERQLDRALASAGPTTD
ncbi:MAG TPA: CRISPR-associated protein Cas4 [Pirellulales bacterium]|jgi:CRISPR-associated exonuclease Cas4